MPIPATQMVNVRISDKLNLDQTHKVVASVLGKLGCAACFSGFDIRFNQHIAELSVDAKTLEVREVGR